MPGYQISICDYSFSVVWKTPMGKVNREIVEVKMAPLIGFNKNEIITDPTGYNANTMRRIYKRTHGSSNKNINQFIFCIIWIDIIKHCGKTQWK